MNRKPTIGYLEVLRECPGFRRLWISRVISLLGDWFSLLAVVALLRELYGTDPEILGGLLILKILPIALAGPIAGVVADRFRRLRIMIFSDLARVLLVLLLLAAPLIGAPVLWIYGLVLLQVVATAFFEPARSAALPQLVPAKYLTTANALGAISWSVVFAAGAAIGGFVTDAVGWRAALVIDAGTYLVSAALLVGIALPHRERKRPPANDWKTLTGIRDVQEGLGLIRRRLDLATVLFIKFGWGFAGAITLFLTLRGERLIGQGARPDLGIALLYFARAVGTGIGPILARRLVDEDSAVSMRRVLLFCYFWPVLFYFAFSFADGVVTSMACVALAHFGGSTLWVFSTVLLQKLTPDEFRGRVMSTDFGLATLAISLSTWVYGWLAKHTELGLDNLIRILALSMLLPALIWWMGSRKFLRRTTHEIND